MGLQDYAHFIIGESPFHLAYGMDVIILVDRGELNRRIANPTPVLENAQMLKEDPNFLYKTRSLVALNEATVKEG